MRTIKLTFELSELSWREIDEALQVAIDACENEATKARLTLARRQLKVALRGKVEKVPPTFRMVALADIFKPERL